MMIRFMIMLIAGLFILAGCGGDSTSVADQPTGAGTFAAGGDYNVGDSPRSVATKDLNGDGILDLVVANAGSTVDGLLVVGTDKVAVLLGNDDGSGKGDGTFAPAVDYDAGTAPVFVVIGNLDGDGIPDLVVANSGSANVSVLMGNVNGDGTFPTAAVDYSVGESPRSVAIGDLNADGILDLAVANSGSIVNGLLVDGTDNVSVLLGNGNGTFAAAVDYEAGTAPYSVAIGNLDTDLIPDLAVANFSSLNISVLKGSGNGDGTFADAVNYAVGARPRSLVIEDLDGDLNPDLVVVNSFSNSISVLIADAEETFAPAVNYAAGTNPLGVALGDLNGDEILDLAVVNQLSDNVTVLVGNSD